MFDFKLNKNKISYIRIIITNFLSLNNFYLEALHTNFDFKSIFY
jgi:hypothetical protein